MLYVIMYFFFTLLLLYIYLMLIFSHLTFDNDGMKSSKRQVTFISLIFLLKCFPKSTTIKFYIVALFHTFFITNPFTSNGFVIS